MEGGYASLVIFCAAVAIFISLVVITKTDNAKIESVHDKAVKLGLFNAPPEIEERHVWISEHGPGAGRYGDIPVHIMFRTNISAVWQLRGIGTKLGKRPNYVLTAYHYGKAGSHLPNHRKP